MNERRRYKRYLETSQLQDVPRDSLKRRKKQFKNSLQKQKFNTIVENVAMNHIDEIEACQKNCNPAKVSVTLQESLEDYNESTNEEENIIIPDAKNEEYITDDESTECRISSDDDYSEDSDIDINDTQNSRVRNLDELVLNEEFWKIITRPVGISTGEIIAMILKFILTYKLSSSASCNILTLVNNIFTSAILPDSKYMLDKLLNPKLNVQYHGICPNCGIYVGRLQDLEAYVACKICSLRIDLSKPSLENIFIIIDPTDNIQRLISSNDEYYNHVVNERKYNGQIRDIYDGKCYRNFVKSLSEVEKSSYVTAVINTDGAPKFECSKNSIWPIYLLVNEIPIEERLKNAIVCGIWFGRDKPPMESFLEPFVEQINELTVNGFECQIKNDVRTLKLYVLLACVDSVARSPMQGMKQYNGYFGCNWCLHEGEWFEGSIRYPITSKYPRQRTHENTIQFAKIVVKNNNELEHYKGVKHASPLINLTGFDIIQGFVPDYMHCILAGVGKQITEYLLYTMSAEAVTSLDDFIKAIKAPRQVARLTRSIEDRKNWKAKEWENFVLYYSVPLFRLFLKKHLLEYWNLLVEGLFILLKNNITRKELDNADIKLHEFYIKTEKLFSKKAMTYNIHQLLHISKSVSDWGPLWSHSTFPFESANHDILQAIHCAKGVNLQIVRYLNYQKSLKILEKHVDTLLPSNIISFKGDITKKKTKKSLKIANITYLGKTVVLNNETITKYNLSAESTVAYTRAVIKNCLYASQNRKNKRSDNSYCRLSDGKFVRIVNFVINLESREELILCSEVKIEKLICHPVYLINKIENEYRIEKTEKICTICVHVKVNNIHYIAELPNILKY